MDENDKIQLLSEIFFDANREKISVRGSMKLERNLNKLGNALLGRNLKPEETRKLCSSMGYVW